MSKKDAVQTHRYDARAHRDTDLNIEKTHSKAGIIFPLIWLTESKPRLYLSSSGGRIACCLFCLVLSSLRSLRDCYKKLERCQSWFLKHILNVPSFAPGLLF